MILHNLHDRNELNFHFAGKMVDRITILDFRAFENIGEYALSIVGAQNLMQTPLNRIITTL